MLQCCSAAVRCGAAHPSARDARTGRPDPPGGSSVRTRTCGICRSSRRVLGAVSAWLAGRLAARIIYRCSAARTLSTCLSGCLAAGCLEMVWRTRNRTIRGIQGIRRGSALCTTDSPVRSDRDQVGRQVGRQVRRQVRRQVISRGVPNQTRDAVAITWSRCCSAISPSSSTRTVDIGFSAWHEKERFFGSISIVYKGMDWMTGKFSIRIGMRHSLRICSLFSL